MNIVLLPEDAANKQQVVIDDKAQVAHIHKVLGLGVGDTLKIGVLSGNIGTAVIEQMLPVLECSNDVSTQHSNKANQKTVVSSIVLSHIQCDGLPPPKLDLTVILALPRPKVLRRLIMDMTAIGVKHIVLVNSYRSDKSYWQSPMLKRLDEFVQEGLQQGVDTVAPTISLRKRFKPFVEDELSQWTQSQTAVVAHPYAEQSLRNFEQQQEQPQILCIGAEGGWIDYEIDLLTANGCHTVSLGRRILRTEAAVNALCGRYF